MNYKVEGALRRNRKNFIIYIVVWLFIAIVLIAPVVYSFQMAKAGGSFDSVLFVETFGKSITNPFGTLGNIFSNGVTQSYFSAILVVSIFYFLFVFIGLIRSAPKNEYSDIEHGSSDWSQRGEQYQILNKNKGIILAEDNYLPVDKRGNVNVLVVGRIRFW